MKNQDMFDDFSGNMNIAKNAASCRRELQNEGLKGSERHQQTVPKQCGKTHRMLDPF